MLPSTTHGVLKMKSVGKQRLPLSSRHSFRGSKALIARGVALPVHWTTCIVNSFALSRSAWESATFAILFSLICLAPNVNAHPFHLCVGQMKWNANRQIWEVSIRLHPQDLEAAMTKQLRLEQPNVTVDIDDIEFPKQAIQYLNRNLFVRRTPEAMKIDEIQAILKLRKEEDSKAIEDRSKLEWIGMESEKGWLWIHVEMKSPRAEPEKHALWMINRLLMDHVERQENTMSIDPTVSPKYSLQFKLGEEVKAMK
jgi:hypothetical protein